MSYFNKLLKIKTIKDAMLDEKSKILFEAKIDYMITRDSEQFCNIADSQERGWYCPEVEEKIKGTNVKGIIIFGAGHDGKRTKRILENCNYSVDFFCDSSAEKIGKTVDGSEIIPVDKVCKEYNDYLVILGSPRYAEEMYHLLQIRNFPEKNILYPKYNMIVAQCGRQYFDVFSANEDEIFIDGGAYNGDTVLDFIDWTNKSYNKIYVFEPIDKMHQLISERFRKKNLKQIKLYNNALWDKKEELYFDVNEAGSHVVDKGASLIKGLALDEVVKSEKVTFIKLDIEGSELNALRGSQNTIIKNKPRLAVCIYHKPEDIIEIPEYILSLVPEYKFYIRHYTSCLWETVLYAEVSK